MNAKKKKIIKKETPKNKTEKKETTLGDIIKNVDQAVVITTTNGNINVIAIKSINYVYEAKGLIMGAIDTYNNRPIINGINNQSKIILSHIMNLNNKIKEALGEKVKEEKKEKI